MPGKYFNLVNCYEHHEGDDLVYKHLVFERAQRKDLKDKYIKLEFYDEYNFKENNTFKVHDCAKYPSNINSFIKKLFSKDYVFSPSHILLRDNLLKEEYVGLLLKCPLKNGCDDNDKLIIYSVNPSTKLFDKVLENTKKNKNILHGLRIKQSQIKYSKYIDPCYEDSANKKIQTVIENSSGLPKEIIEHIIQPYYREDFENTIFKIDNYDREFLLVYKDSDIKKQVGYWDNIEMLYVDFIDDLNPEELGVVTLPKNLKTLILNYENPGLEDNLAGLHEIVEAHEELERLIILSPDKILLHNCEEEQPFPNLKTLILRDDYPITEKEIKIIKNSIDTDEFRTVREGVDIKIYSKEDIISSLKNYKMVNILENIEDEKDDKFFSSIDYTLPKNKDTYMENFQKLNKIKQERADEYQSKYEYEYVPKKSKKDEDKKYSTDILKLFQNFSF